MNEISAYKTIRELLIKRQNILSQLTRKWTDKELDEYDNVLSENEIKIQILNLNEGLFDDIEINMLKRKCVR